MKTLLLPLAILFLATACNKQVMPGPDNVKDSPKTLRPTSAMRMGGDTLVRITRHPSESKPLTNQKLPDIGK